MPRFPAVQPGGTRASQTAGIPNCTVAGSLVPRSPAYQPPAPVKRDGITNCTDPSGHASGDVSALTGGTASSVLRVAASTFAAIPLRSLAFDLQESRQLAPHRDAREHSIVSRNVTAGGDTAAATEGGLSNAGVDTAQQRSTISALASTVGAAVSNPSEAWEDWSGAGEDHPRSPSRNAHSPRIYRN